MTVREAARRYQARGWVPIPVPLRSKAPAISKWQELRPNALEVMRLFKRDCNVGVHLGEPSHGLVDVDLDCAESVRLAPRFLSATRTFGRASKRHSHWIYIAEGASTLKLAEPSNSAGKRQMLVELRASIGLQTIFPPSTHPTGEAIDFDDGCAAEPAHADPSDLAERVRRLATAAMLTRHGLSDDAACALVEAWSETAAATIPTPVAAQAREWLSIPPGVPFVGSVAPRLVSGDRASVLKRAAAYLSKMPVAISGSGGHAATWNAAVVLVRGFGLDESEAFGLLEQEHNPRCDPPWSEKELRHKIATASKDARVPLGYLLDDSEHARSSTVASAAESQASDWPPIGPLPGGLAPVPKMTADMLPESLRPWLADIAERAQCPIEFPAIGAIVAVASVVGRSIAIRPKRQDDWTVVPNLWGAIVGRPGIMKTPALQEALKPIKLLAAQAQDSYALATKDAEFQSMVADTERKRLEKELGKLLGAGGDPSSLRDRLLDVVPRPTLKRYIANDSTVEALGVLLNENPRGLLLFRDELKGWLRSLDKDGHENDRAFYLEAWDGKGSYTYDRIGRGTLRIEAACVSVLGGAQPGALGEYLAAAMKGGGADDGLVQRFQLLVYPDIPGDWRNVDRWPDSRAKQRAFDLFAALDKVEPGAVGATKYEDEDLAVLRFATDAQEFFDAWRAPLEARLRAGEDHPALESHFAKYRSLMPSLALLFQLLAAVDGAGPGPVSLASATLAVRWCTFLESHARRVYQAITARADVAAALLGTRIKQGKLPNPFTLRDVYRKGWAGLVEADEVKAAAELLEEAGWVRWMRADAAPPSGRPREGVYLVNPALTGAT